MPAQLHTAHPGGRPQSVNGNIGLTGSRGTAFHFCSLRFKDQFKGGRSESRAKEGKS